MADMREFAGHTKASLVELKSYISAVSANGKEHEKDQFAHGSIIEKVTELKKAPEGARKWWLDVIHIAIGVIAILTSIAAFKATAREPFSLVHVDRRNEPR